MINERPQPVTEATNHDGLASLAIIVLAVILIVFATSQILS